MMKKPSLDIVNLVGIALVIAALVSAGGIYYTASTYSKISESFATTTVMVSDVQITRINETGLVIFTTTYVVDNPSSLDIELYRIEYMAHADISPTTITEYDRYIGSGTLSNRNGTVPAGTIREFQVPFSIGPNSTYMDRFNYAEQNGEVNTFVNGIIWYRISNYQEASNRLDGILFRGKVMIDES